jgi:D-3-phosphoglycerate dehydrogenase
MAAGASNPVNPPLNFTHSIRQPRVLQTLGSKEVKVLLLENISAGAVDSFKAQGYQVDHYAKAWSEEELLKKIGEYHAIGIRSKTKMTEKVLKAATKVSFFPFTHCRPSQQSRTNSSS